MSNFRNILRIIKALVMRPEFRWTLLISVILRLSLKFWWIEMLEWSFNVLRSIALFFAHHRILIVESKTTYKRIFVQRVLEILLISKDGVLNRILLEEQFWDRVLLHHSKCVWHQMTLTSRDCVRVHSAETIQIRWLFIHKNLNFY